MKLLLVLLAATVALASSAAVKKSDVSSVYQFGKFISCYGGAGFFDGLDYNGYGCYCGYGGKGTPLDDTDRCCQVHDNCYGKATAEADCGSWDPYVIIYDYEQTTDASGNCVIKCKKAADYSWYSTNPECREFMCECDRAGAQCFAEKRPTYNQAYESYDKDSC
ncbi:phospholipase A2 AP-PLA2-I-like [Patiria miniata]|uniref:Phospholipase A2 n=1 Tax=Patiria miniata TaxID=46514 RepID=A0A913ZDU7_PATMI|nr:phospholipase A2 AP-PLA2-I-like [Patiria miniata]